MNADVLHHFIFSFLLSLPHLFLHLVLMYGLFDWWVRFKLMPGVCMQVLACVSAQFHHPTSLFTSVLTSFLPPSIRLVHRSPIIHASFKLLRLAPPTSVCHGIHQICPSLKRKKRKKKQTWKFMCTRWSVTLNDISVVMVKPCVMTGSSSVVRPFQQSSSMQRQPDRRTCLYISTEEFPASWPAALHKETNSTWGCIHPQSTAACASMFGEHAMKEVQLRGKSHPCAAIREPITSSH